MIEYTCAQRGCKFFDDEPPERCPVCKNPFTQNARVGQPHDHGDAVRERCPLMRRWNWPAVLLVGVMLAGCEVFAPLVDRSSSAAAEAVEAYCEQLTADQRQIFGDQVRVKAAPNSITVDCAG